MRWGLPKNTFFWEGRMSRVLGSLLVFPFIVLGQTNGRLTGSVTDPSGAAVPKAAVNLVLHAGKRALISTQTSNEGTFSMEAIRPELYDLLVDANGFQPFRLEN